MSNSKEEHVKAVLTIDELADAVAQWLSKHRGLHGVAKNVKMNLSETASGTSVFFFECDRVWSEEKPQEQPQEPPCPTP